MSGGWIKMHRKITEWEWYTDGNVYRLFMHCLYNANHKDKRYRGKVIKGGSFLTGTELLAAQLNLGRQQIRTSLKKLELTGEIVKKSTSLGTLVTVTNYESYQSVEVGVQPTSNQQDNQRVTNEQPTSNQRVTTNKNIKKERKKEIKEEKKTSRRVRVREGEIPLIEILEVYKTCLHITSAQDEWRRLDTTTQEKIKEHSTAFRERYEQVGKLQYLPDFKTYLYERMYDRPLPHEDLINETNKFDEYLKKMTE